MVSSLILGVSLVASSVIFAVGMKKLSEGIKVTIGQEPLTDEDRKFIEDLYDKDGETINEQVKAVQEVLEEFNGVMLGEETWVDERR